MVQTYLIGKRNAYTTLWTEERTALLVRWWAEGHTATEIAKRFGDITRCGVKSKVDRLDLPARKPGRPKRVPRR